MKIGSGICRGLRLTSPSGDSTRPTSSKVREAVMSMLQFEVEGAVFLDFFSGSGAMGLEALSRGAAKVVFVEQDPKAVRVIKKNLQEVSRCFEKQGLKLGETKILPTSVAKCWKFLLSSKPVQMIWADPPYDFVESWLQAGVFEQLNPLTESGAIFMLESDSKFVDNKLLTEMALPFGWEYIKSKTYGSTAITLWKKR